MKNIGAQYLKVMEGDPCIFFATFKIRGTWGLQNTNRGYSI
jgi:hypothetical protein